MTQASWKFFWKFAFLGAVLFFVGSGFMPSLFPLMGVTKEAPSNFWQGFAVNAIAGLAFWAFVIFLLWRGIKAEEKSDVTTPKENLAR